MNPTKKQRSEKRFFLSLFVIVLTLFAACGIYNAKHPKTSDTQITPTSVPVKLEPKISNSTTPDQLSVVSGIVYRHLVAYNLVCTDAHMPLKQYPDYFSQQFSKEIQQINTAWLKRGKSLESVLLDYDAQIYPKIATDIKKELLDIERRIVKAIKAKESKTTIDKIEWTEKQENALNLADACMLFDETAQSIVEKSDFKKLFTDLMSGL
ncbi:MAG: hypothetical protein IJO11_00150 [Alphaproteobacteria bacterium]|nr:hypothetical protein [Alphaproteobacteria bacterium]MBR3913104.1 hypothetical protein [Alphaproteobacteria bacterium]